MSRVFISHSREDRELTRNVAEALRNIGVDSFIMEYAPKGKNVTPPWEIIRQEVYKSDYMMLFKTDNAIQTDYTKNWIVFEVGLAAAWKKRLIVFERRGKSIHFPIPYVTDYMIFEPQKVSDMLKLQRVAKELKEELDKKPVANDDDDKPGWGLLFFLLPELFAVFLMLKIVGHAFGGPIPVICPNINCKSEYQYFGSVFDSFQCPICLAPLDPKFDT